MINKNKWFGVKCLFIHENMPTENNTTIYEERVIVVTANDSNWAFKKGTKEAKDYARSLDGTDFLEYIECYEISEEEITDRTEILSIKRKSDLDENDFISEYYDSDEHLTTTHPTSDYGIDGDVTAFGPFSPDIAEYLDHDEKYYKDTKAGTTVIVESILYSSGKEESFKLTECLGINYLDFNQHELNHDLINIFMLKKEFGEEDTKRYMKLRDHGFTFFFIPYIDNPDLLNNK